MTEDDLNLYAAENEPEFKFVGHVHHISIPRNRHSTFPIKQSPRIYVEVDSSGLINIHDYGSWFGKSFGSLTHAERMEVYDWLTEWELAEWRNIGPEDRELFATKKLDSEWGLDDAAYSY